MDGQTRHHHKELFADAGAVITEQCRSERMEGEVTCIFVAGYSRMGLLCKVGEMLHWFNSHTHDLLMQTQVNK